MDTRGIVWPHSDERVMSRPDRKMVHSAAGINTRLRHRNCRCRSPQSIRPSIISLWNASAWYPCGFLGVVNCVYVPLAFHPSPATALQWIEKTWTLSRYVGGVYTPSICSHHFAAKLDVLDIEGDQLGGGAQGPAEHPYRGLE